MPADPAIFGFASHWQGASLPWARNCELPSGARIRVVPPPFLVATKLEAFAGRGHHDFMGSRDFSDVVALIDGRESLADEVRDAPAELCRYLADELTQLLEHDRVLDGLYAQLPPDAASQQRAETVVMPRITAIVDAARKRLR